MKTYVKCNKCNSVFLVDSDDVRRYESMKDYANSLLLEYSVAMSQGMTQYAYKKMTESNLIENNAIDPYKCPSCGSTNCYIMSNDEAKKYVDQINSAKKRADEDAKLKLEREKAFLTQINPNATVEQLKERILTYIEDEEWFMAEHYIEHTLDIASDDYYLYYLKFLVLNKCKGNDDLKKKHIPFDIRNNVCAKIFRYADNAFKKQMADHNFDVVVDLACSIPDKHANQIYDTCIDFIINCKLTEETELGKKLYTRVSALLKDKQGDLTNRYNFVFKCYENDNNTKYGEFLIDIFLEALKHSVEKDKSDVFDKYIDNDLLFNKFIIGEQEEIVKKINDKYKIDGQNLELDSQYNTISNILKQISRINSKINDDSNSYKSLFDSKLKDLVRCFDICIDKLNDEYDDLIINRCDKLLKQISLFEQFFKNNADIIIEIDKIRGKCNKVIYAAEQRVEAEKQKLAEKKKIKKTKLIKILKGSALAVAIFIIICFITFNILRTIKYNNAIKALNLGDYDVAYNLLEQIGEEEVIKSNKYDRAMELLKKEDYDMAYELFEEIGDIETIKLNKYDRANQQIKLSNYEEAYKLLNGLDYKDSDIKLRKIKPEYIKKMLSALKVGDYIDFGKREQDGKSDNGKEDIAWQILAIEDNRVLLISKFSLLYSGYNSGHDDSWENSLICRRLNDEFINDSFTTEEQNIINDTANGKVFILSEKEASRYFNSPEERKCLIYNSSKYNKYKCVWWLRDEDGFKRCVDKDGEYITISGNMQAYVRPSMWVSIK